MSILPNPPRIRSAADIPPAGKGKQGADEDLLWRELLAARAGFDYGTNAWRKRAGSVEALAGMGSPNHAQLSFAVWYLLRPDEKIGGMNAREFWRAVARWQLGIEKPPVDGVAGFLECSEPQSNDYQGYTVGAWLAVLERAFRDGDGEVSVELQRLVRAWAAMTTLFSMPPSSSILLHGLGGDVPIKNPSRTLTRLPVGARSTAQHLHADPGALILSDLIGYPGSHPHPARDPFDFWYLVVSGSRGDWLDPEDAATMRAAIDGDLDALDRVAAMIPPTARWVGRLEVWRWQDQALGVAPRVLNGNTSWNPLAVAHRGGVLEVWNPWPKPKCPGLETGRAVVGNGFASCASGYGDLPNAVLPHGAPLRRYVFDQDGLHVEANGSVATSRRDTPVPPPPREPTPPAGANYEELARIVRGFQVSSKMEAAKRGALEALAAGDGRRAREHLEGLGFGPRQEQYEPWQMVIRELQGE